MKRTDPDGRDVTDSPGLWSVDDTITMSGWEWEECPLRVFPAEITEDGESICRCQMCGGVIPREDWPADESASLRDLAEKHGMDYGDAPEQSLDLETGKRIINE